MLGYVVRRLLYTIPLLLGISFALFGLMELMPGDYCTPLRLQDEALYKRCVAALGLERPFFERYLDWIGGILTRGDFGYSFQTQRPVLEQLFLAGDARSGTPLLWTLVISLGTMLLSWLFAVPLGIWAATRRGRWPDHAVSFLGFVGLSLPNFFLALVILWVLVVGLKVGQVCWESPTLGETVCLGVSGLFDGRFASAPWTGEKFLNLLWHLWPAALVIGAANVGALLRYTRGEMLTVLGEPYVRTARAKGLSERVVIWKHALKNALNPLISMLGYWLPLMFEGALVASMILQLPTVERAYWTALRTGDPPVILAGLLFFSVVLVVGNLLADVLLAWVNPKIRYE